MTRSKELRELERWIGYVRWAGLVFAALSAVLEPAFPTSGTRSAAWGLVAILLAGTLAIRVAMHRATAPRDLERLTLAAFLFDMLIVIGFMSVYAFEMPYVTWALVFLIPIEGALRYRLKGALAGALMTALFFIPLSSRVQSFHGVHWHADTYAFVVALSALLAGLAGSMANNWFEQRSTFELQSIKLIELDQLKDRFLAVTSHEIRGPLTTIISGVDMIRRRSDRLTPDNRDKILEAVANQSLQLARLVDDLLLTSQLQTGQLDIQPEWRDLELTVRQALEAAAPKRRDHRVEVFVEPVRCHVDGARIAQIVRNLVENAYKYTPDRTRVSVSGKKDNGGIRLQVTDDGPGIPADKRDQLFEAFSRVQGTSGQDGVGLGLFVVSHLVSAMNGRIDLVASSKGTGFDIFVPCSTEPAEPPLSIVPHQLAADAG